jgi:exonuclease VII small subunit
MAKKQTYEAALSELQSIVTEIEADRKRCQ